MEKRYSIFDIYSNNHPFRDQFYKEMLIFDYVIDIKDLWHFDRVSAYFSDTSQNFPVHKVSFWIGRLMYYEQIKVIIRQAWSLQQNRRHYQRG